MVPAALGVLGKQADPSPPENRAGGMSQRLRALAVFVETQVQFPAAKWWLTATCNPSSRGHGSLNS